MDGSIPAANFTTNLTVPEIVSIAPKRESGHGTRRLLMIRKVIKGIKNVSAFSLGMFIGVVYGSIIGTLVAAAMLGMS